MGLAGDSARRMALAGQPTSSLSESCLSSEATSSLPWGESLFSASVMSVLVLLPCLLDIIPPPYVHYGTRAVGSYAGSGEGGGR